MAPLVFKKLRTCPPAASAMKCIAVRYVRFDVKTQGAVEQVPYVLLEIKLEGIGTIELMDAIHLILSLNQLTHSHYRASFQCLPISVFFIN